MTILAALAALGAVLGLILLAGRAAKATGLGRHLAGQRLIPRESVTLDRARTLRIVSCDGRDLLLLTGGTSDLVVGWLPSGAEARP